MGRKNIYTVFSRAGEGEGESYRVVKMDRDFEWEGEYEVKFIPIPEKSAAGRGIWLCTCFAGTREICRHRTLVEMFKEHKAVDSRKAYDFDRAKWVDPPAASLVMM